MADPSDFSDIAQEDENLKIIFATSYKNIIELQDVIQDGRMHKYSLTQINTFEIRYVKSSQDY
jgi:uncharacterized protein involved in tolerance to divalent cations